MVPVINSRPSQEGRYNAKSLKSKVDSMSSHPAQTAAALRIRGITLPPFTLC